ncbi:hypothetical protein CHLNCDRAFT_138797 [Chlorella variabilis]|uniref:NodB homology domain-containing protein n=1 Tax=Chlorella variabilis TaxID=554065 RepID=E1ZNS3_CHLVA|nr:hypothetical protein CHLNCDRAFT_138797 [Chlorella variabilis]EFN52368.1 hypothetical protein CHLNCDRAFT_138797 [Chlorella variabilis]|eukprot:XP_005844470.1 hypothetical protein CHLNCDRAFT_138797 [Chlorella variabilis]
MHVALALIVLTAAASVEAGIDASTSAPGGLSPSQTPQFHDDAITEGTYNAMTDVTGGRGSLDLGRGSCPALATFFTTTSGTRCDLAVDLYNQGHEIADHTKTHKSFLELDGSDLRREIVGAREKLAECGIPEQDVVGLRAPYLETKPEVRAILHENGFLYDSSLIEDGTGRSITWGMDGRVWPWDMENGIPINCGWYNSIQKCDEDEYWPGLWQVPVWDLSALGGPYTMDYGDDGDHSVFDILKENFDAAYNGNRAPFPIFIHTPWLKDHKGDVQQFADYALSQPDVYFITIRQLLAWMSNPIPADQLTPAGLGCGSPGGAGPSPTGTYMGTYSNSNGTGSAAPAPAPATAPTPEPSVAPTPAPGEAEEELVEGAPEEEVEGDGTVARRMLR